MDSRAGEEVVERVHCAFLSNRVIWLVVSIVLCLLAAFFPRFARFPFPFQINFGAVCPVSRFFCAIPTRSHSQLDTALLYNILLCTAIKIHFPKCKIDYSLQETIHLVSNMNKFPLAHPLNQRRSLSRLFLAFPERHFKLRQFNRRPR